MNKKGANVAFPIVIVLVIIFLMIIVDVALGEEFNLIPRGVDFANHYGNARGFEEAFSSPAFKPLNYLFGYIPQILIDITGGGSGTTPDNLVSAGLVIIALWTIIFLIFADIMNVFGPFSKYVNWAVAVLFAIIGANIKLVSYVAVYFLVIFSTFGSFAILLSLFMPILIFILFHFGGQTIRTWVILRRAQDRAIRAVAGGKEAAGAIEGLGEIGKGLEKIAKK